MKNCSPVLLFLLCPFASGCSSGAPVTADPTPKDPAGKEVAFSDSTVVAEVKLSESHDVEIMENADGIVAVVEKGAIDADKPLVDLENLASTSLVALYEQLQTQAADPKASKVDMARLKTLDELKVAALAKGAATGPQPEELVYKASSWGNYLAPNYADTWNWWSNGPCNRHTYRCEIGFSGQTSFTHANPYITYSHFNMSTTTSSTATLLWDPCYNASIFDFCTQPYKVVSSWTEPPWTYATVFTYSNNGDSLLWEPIGSGDLWGWAVTFDNPRTW